MLSLRPVGHGHLLPRARRHKVFAHAAFGTIPAPDERATARVRLGAALPREGVVRFNPPELIHPWHVGTTLRNKVSGHDVAALVTSAMLDDQIATVVTRKARPSRITFLSLPEQIAFTKGERYERHADSDVSIITSALWFGDGSRRVPLYEVASSLDSHAAVKKIADSTPGEVRSTRLNSPMRNALAIQIDGFARYLRTAETHSFAEVDLARMYREYLPWAIALDVTDEWNSTFAAVPGLGKDVAYLSSRTHAIVDSPIGDLGSEVLGEIIGSFVPDIIGDIIGGLFS